MRTFALLAACATLIAASGSTIAQDKAAAPAAAASMPMDCTGMKRHDHGAERHAPSGKAMPCAPVSAASKPAAKARTKPAHDHAKFHKNQ